MNKQPEIQARTKNNLTQAFWSLYKEKSIDKISIKEITDLAGYNRSTFYLYYTDIYSILEQLEQKILDNIIEHLKHFPADTSLDGNMLEYITKLYQDEGEYLCHLITADPSFSQKFHSTLRTYSYRFIPDTQDWKNACYLEFGLSTITAALYYWYKNQDSICLDEYIILLRKYLYNGRRSD